VLACGASTWTVQFMEASEIAIELVLMRREGRGDTKMGLGIRPRFLSSSVN